MAGKTSGGGVRTGASTVLTASRENEKRRNDIIERIDRQITRIEEVVTELLSDLSVDEMSAYQRLSVAIRFISQHQRALVLRQSCELDEPSDREQMMMAALMQRMRGDGGGVD